MARPPMTDGFKAMIEKDHAGAKEERRDVVAEYFLTAAMTGTLDRHDALVLADDLLKWLDEGDTLEG